MREEKIKENISALGLNDNFFWKLMCVLIVVYGFQGEQIMLKIDINVFVEKAFNLWCQNVKQKRLLLLFALFAEHTCHMLLRKKCLPKNICLNKNICGAYNMLLRKKCLLKNICLNKNICRAYNKLWHKKYLSKIFALQYL